MDTSQYFISLHCWPSQSYSMLYKLLLKKTSPDTIQQLFVSLVCKKLYVFYRISDCLYHGYYMLFRRKVSGGSWHQIRLQAILSSFFIGECVLFRLLFSGSLQMVELFYVSWTNWQLIRQWQFVAHLSPFQTPLHLR